MASTYLVGGGWSAHAMRSTIGRFIAAAGASPVIACVLLDQPGPEQYFARFADRLGAAGASAVRPVFVGRRHPLELSHLDAADGVLIGGGLTPGYMEALAPVRTTLATWLAARDVPYAGFSAGAAIAARAAIIGGWRMTVPGGMTTVCPEEVAEDLHEVTVVEGLGLVPFTVDVHASSWGTLSRLVSVVHAGEVHEGWAVDEDTMLVHDRGRVTVHGTGRAYHVRATGTDVTIAIHQPTEADRRLAEVAP